MHNNCINTAQHKLCKQTIADLQQQVKLTTTMVTNNVRLGDQNMLLNKFFNKFLKFEREWKNTITQYTPDLYHNLNMINEKLNIKANYMEQISNHNPINHQNKLVTTPKLPIQINKSNNNITSTNNNNINTNYNIKTTTTNSLNNTTNNSNIPTNNNTTNNSNTPTNTDDFFYQIFPKPPPIINRAAPMPKSIKSKMPSTYVLPSQNTPPQIVKVENNTTTNQIDSNHLPTDSSKNDSQLSTTPNSNNIMDLLGINPNQIPQVKRLIQLNQSRLLNDINN